jgi:valyl-tRNA synthetase
VVIAPWPERHPEHRDQDAEVQFSFAQEIVTTIRRFRKAHGLRDSLPLSVSVSGSAAQRDVAVALRPEIQRLAAVSMLEVTDEPANPTGSARLTAAGAQVLIPLAGVLDPETERDRLRARLDEIEQAAGRSDAKLRNEGFVAKAPAQVVEQERRRLEEAKEEAAALAAQLEELG